MASTELRAAAQQALEALEGGADSWQLVGPAIDALKAALAEPVQEPWEHLKQYGYAPGSYMSRCHACDQIASGVDKRAITCRPCAEARHAALAEPTTEESSAVEPVQEPVYNDLLRLVGNLFDEAYKAGQAAATAQPALQTCNCRWGGETQVQQCTLHEAHVDAIHEWAERAKAAEKKLAVLAEPQEPDLSRCPKCTGPADNGHDREVPPNPYYCTKCMAEPVEPVAWRYQDARGNYRYRGYVQGFDKEYSLLKPVPLYTSPPHRPAEPVQEALTIERLRDALVASRIVPPAAVEDPDEYDDGVTLHRIEALHRRLA